MAISIPVINKLLLAKHLFWLANDNLLSHRDVALFASVNLLQDAVESFLLAAAEHVNASINSGTTFEKYFDLIDEKIAPRALPFRAKLVALNKVRIAAKHHGVKPDRSEACDFGRVCKEFFEEGSTLLFDLPFWSLSLIDLLEDGESKELLKSAQRAFDQGDWLTALIECRKFVFIEFERNYNIEPFRRDDGKAGLFGPFSDAPYYARQKSYIEQNVTTPFGYIAVDHAHLDSQLLKNGIDTQIYWNIWRLTPEVYRFRADGKFIGDWLVKRELQKEDEASESNAAYVLENAIDIALHLLQRRRLAKHIGHKSFFVTLKHDQVKLYTKADQNSPVQVITAPGIMRLDVTYSTVGLDGEGLYWNVSDWDRNPEIKGMEKFYYGYLHSDDVDWSMPQDERLELGGTAGAIESG